MKLLLSPVEFNRMDDDHSWLLDLGGINMAKKSKTRFTYLYEGERYEIFSVCEDGEGGLSIYTKIDQRIIDSANNEESVKENRFSVHASSNSSGTLIKQSVVYENGKKSHACSIYSHFERDARGAGLRKVPCQASFASTLQTQRQR